MKIDKNLDAKDILMSCLLGEINPDLSNWVGINDATINYLFSKLEENEEKVLRLRFGFKDGFPKTLREIGEIIGRNPERVRQLEAKALRKLRRPGNIRFLRYGIEGALEKEKENITNFYKNKIDKEYKLDYNKELDISILNLSSRPYNCLYRKGIKTIPQLMEMSDDDLYKIRNLGPKSFKEIKEAMSFVLSQK